MHTSTLLFTRGVVAQWVERWTSDLEIAGCTPLATKGQIPLRYPGPRPSFQPGFQQVRVGLRMSAFRSYGRYTTKGRTYPKIFSTL